MREKERTTRFADLADQLLGGTSHPGLDFDLIEKSFLLLFSNLPTTGIEKSPP
jgi:hypothetical protein